MPDRPPLLGSPVLVRLVGVLAVVAVVWFLRASAPVTLPLTVALFALVLSDPLRERLARRVPEAAAVALTFAVAVAVLVGFTWAVVEAADEAFEGLQAYRPELRSLQDRVEGRLGFDVRGAAEGRALGAASGVWATLGGVVLVYALLALGLAEVRRWREKVEGRFSDAGARRALGVARRIARQVQRFVTVQLATSVLTGVLTGLFCWAFGLELAVVWGVLAGILNLIPTLGSIVAVVPPALFALLQYGVGWQAPAVLAGLAAVQVVLGAYVDPRLQGRYLELSPFVVLVAIAFWGWLWGIAGAFVAVPLTAAVVAGLGAFERTEWAAWLLTRRRPDADDPEPGEEPAPVEAARP